MASFEKINYNIRANKSIERKMIAEVLQKLVFFRPLNEYRYIGFGSAYFTDFILFHKVLGMNDMISIEINEGNKNRFDFNKPFSCINIEYGSSTTVLPNLELDKKNNIIWLDYDGKISNDTFSDIDSIVLNACSGSVFLVSLNVEVDRGKEDNGMNQLIKDIGKERIPIEFLEEKINQRTYPKIVYEMIDRQVKKTLMHRNGGSDSEIKYFQLFHYLYKDGANMLTIGGILANNTQERLINKMKLDEIRHLSFDNKEFKISCPNLTYKEVHLLNNLLPCELELTAKGTIRNSEFKKVHLGHSDIIKYSELYKYYPNFAETNL